MAVTVELELVQAGDFEYIAKHNTNWSKIQNALNSLFATAGNATGVTVGAYFTALFNGATTRIGTNSYNPEVSGAVLDISAGAAFRASTQTVVSTLLPTAMDFTGQPADTYYIDVDSVGTPTMETELSADTMFVVTWNGSTLTGLIKQAPTIFDNYEMNDARSADSPEVTYDSLDDRLEAMQSAIQVLEDAVGIGGPAATTYRKIGCNSGSTTGIVGAIPVDFEGTIVGWLAIADQVGDLVIEVSRGRTGAPPPAAPVIPNPVSDLISGSSHIELSGQQSKSVAAAGVSDWDTDVLPWDVFQFKVASITTITRCTVYLLVEEAT